MGIPQVFEFCLLLLLLQLLLLLAMKKLLMLLLEIEVLIERKTNKKGEGRKKMKYCMEKMKKITKKNKNKFSTNDKMTRVPYLIFFIKHNRKLTEGITLVNGKLLMGPN
jgi:hypothetical protein